MFLRQTLGLLCLALVAGALAFAAGAALGAALPHTEQEDKAVGKLGDEVRHKAAEVAGEVYEDTKARAADLYEKGKEGVSELYDEVAHAGEASSSSQDRAPGYGMASRN